MRTIADFVWNAWNAGGPFVGGLASHAVVRVSPSWGFVYKDGFSWLTDIDQNPFSPTYLEALPPPVTLSNVLSIETDESLDQDASTCTIIINNWALGLGDDTQLGEKGYLSYGGLPSGNRWGHDSGVGPPDGSGLRYIELLHPNSRIETWQGYGGREKTFGNAVADGNIYKTGVWLIDDVVENSDGTLEVRCRSLAKILVDEPITPWTIPQDPLDQGRYPLEYVPGFFGYTDYADIVTELLAWAGWLVGGGVGDYPSTSGIFANVESTGAVSSDQLPISTFDKRPFMDGINAVKEVVGYNFWLDNEGAAHFESGNYWDPGNFNEVGEHLDFIPDIDERLQLTQYAATISDRALPAAAIVSDGDPYAMVPGPDGNLNKLVTEGPFSMAVPLLGWHSFHGPAVWTDSTFGDPSERAALVWLICMQALFTSRLGSVTCPANPAIQIDDQVRIWEEASEEVYVHHVRGKATRQDLTTGEYTMTLTTHALETPFGWIANVATFHAEDPVTGQWVDNFVDGVATRYFPPFPYRR